MGVQKRLRDVMWMASSNNKAMSNLLGASVKNVLSDIIDELASIKGSIRTFMETRRALFPRFFFLTDVELMDMFSDIHSHRHYSSHLSYIFPGAAQFYIKKIEPSKRQPETEDVDIDIAPFNMFSPAGNELLDPFQFSEESVEVSEADTGKDVPY